MKFRNLMIVLCVSASLFAACAKATDDKLAADTKATEAGKEAAAVQAPAAPAEAGMLGSSKSPIEVVKGAPKGTLKNPYKYKDVSAEVIERGRKKYLGASCNGCHGGTGGGGMCPPLSNSVWVYGSDDDTLYRLITLGSVELTAQTGLARKGRENVVGPMPPHGAIVKTDDDLWKIITFIRSNFRGEAKDITWE
jgi:mono/diheme cytochrome c family protein